MAAGGYFSNKFPEAAQIRARNDARGNAIVNAPKKIADSAKKVYNDPRAAYSKTKSYVHNAWLSDIATPYNNGDGITAGMNLSYSALGIGTIFSPRGAVAKVGGLEGTIGKSKWKGSGPAFGVIGITNETKVGALRNYSPKAGVEFVYNSVSKTFVVGKPARGLFNGSPHEKLAQSINASGNGTVGGFFSRGKNGEIITNENSGHYGTNWTPEIRNNFTNWLGERTGLPVIHQKWGIK
jgi:hypothetical protein